MLSFSKGIINPCTFGLAEAEGEAEAEAAVQPEAVVMVAVVAVGAVEAGAVVATHVLFLSSAWKMRLKDFEITEFFLKDEYMDFNAGILMHGLIINIFKRTLGSLH